MSIAPSLPARLAGRLRSRSPLAARIDARELLDAPGADAREVETNLRDLARLNRLPGGVRTSIAAVAHLGRGRTQLRIVDVGTGVADMPVAFARRGWRTVAVDSHPLVLDAAGQAAARHPGVELLEADALALPFDDGSFDVAHCSLLVHHLDPNDTVATLREMARVAREGVVVNDLRRGVLPLVATGVAVALLGRCRSTRADGIASVRRAYTLDELDELLAAAGLRVAWRSNALMPRVVTAAVRTGAR